MQSSYSSKTKRQRFDDEAWETSEDKKPKKKPKNDYGKQREQKRSYE